MDLSQSLPEVDVPAVVVVGTRDQLTPVSHARRLAELLPDARLEVLPDAGHMANMEQPAAFNDALGRFLQRHA